MMKDTVEKNKNQNYRLAPAAPVCKIVARRTDRSGNVTTSADVELQRKLDNG